MWAYPCPSLKGPLVPLSLGLLLETQRAAGNSLQGLLYRQSHRPGVQQLFLGCPAALTSMGCGKWLFPDITSSLRGLPPCWLCTAVQGRYSKMTVVAAVLGRERDVLWDRAGPSQVRFAPYHRSKSPRETAGSCTQGHPVCPF